jgi:hypothetical protein
MTSFLLGFIENKRPFQSLGKGAIIMRRNMCFAACAGRLFSLGIAAWSLAVVLSSIAPAFGQVPPLPELMLSLNQTEFRSGDTLRVGLGARNPGPAFTADFVFGFFPPDGATACFITDLAPLSVQCLDLTAGPLLVLPPLATRIEVPEGLDGMLNDLFDFFVGIFAQPLEPVHYAEKECWSDWGLSVGLRYR